MKRTKIKRVSKRPIRKLLTDADKALQNWYRVTYPNKRCEVCGRPFNLMHHFFPKSSSARLRFEDSNLIFLCSGCHFRHHNTGDPSIHTKVLKNRGIQWYNELDITRRKDFIIDSKYLASINEKYKLQNL